jgi:hypothetical protein
VQCKLCLTGTWHLPSFALSLWWLLLRNSGQMGYVKYGYISRHADDIIQHTFKVNLLTSDMRF